MYQFIFCWGLLFSSMLFAQEENPSFVLFKKTLGKRQATSVEEFLPLWKQAAPDFFKNYLLAYRSRSLQNSTFLNPRAILFSDTADFVIAFNGNPEHRGFKDIEAMAFNYQKDSFEFYEITEAVLKSGQLPPANPQKCLECHQSASRAFSITQSKVDPRPNWEPYSFWPGFYGSSNDNMDDSQKIHMSQVDTRLTQRAEDAFLLNALFEEEIMYRRFFAEVAPTHVRYQHLHPIENLKRTAPNAAFTKALTILNARRVARLMTEEQQVFDFIKWDLISHIKCKTDIIPEEMEPSMIPYRQTHPRTVGMKNRNTLTDIVNYYFDFFGVDTEDWSMDFKTNGGRFAFIERFGSPGDARTEANGGFDKYISLRPELNSTPCDTIEKKRQFNIQNLPTIFSFKENHKNWRTKNTFPPSPLIERCIHCHVNSNNDDLPYIPFHKKEELAAHLQKKGYKRGTLLAEILWRVGDHATVDEQMPPRGTPSLQQRKELIQYLESLTK